MSAMRPAHLGLVPDLGEDQSVKDERAVYERLLEAVEEALDDLSPRHPLRRPLLALCRSLLRLLQRRA
jgi:hypothetical protein